MILLSPWPLTGDTYTLQFYFSVFEERPIVYVDFERLQVPSKIVPLTTDTNLNNFTEKVHVHTYVASAISISPEKCDISEKVVFTKFLFKH